MEGKLVPPGGKNKENHICQSLYARVALYKYKYKVFSGYMIWTAIILLIMDKSNYLTFVNSKKQKTNQSYKFL